MSLLSEILNSVFLRDARKKVSSLNTDRSMPELVADLLSQRSEITGLSTSGEILQRFSSMSDEEKRAFFTFLANDLDIDNAAVTAALEAFTAQPDALRYGRFQQVAEPPRQEFVRRLNRRPGATAQLVNMRKDLLRLVSRDDPIARIDLDFRHLFASWFNRGFLVLRPINWETPATLLEKIIEYEAVHEITSWDDLRRRVQPSDRRCFAFFHPAIAEEPLIFVEVAITKGIPTSVQSLLAEDRDVVDDQYADTAVFYSISNCQAGLAGVSFGNFLIKQVTEDLATELPQLRTFVTLSPVPKFREWLKRHGLEGLQGEALRDAAADYLLNAKNAKGQPYDSVARFHLSNGAKLHDIHLDADRSTKGDALGARVMVNYLYDRDRIEENHEYFARTAQVVASSKLSEYANRAPSKENTNVEPAV